MTNKQAQELRDIASAATSAPLWHAVGIFGEVVDPANQEWKSVHDFWKTFTAERVLALMNELEAKDKAWSAQDNHINQQADRIESLEKKNGELGRALGAAEERIAELEAREVKLPQVLDVHPLGPQSAKMFWAFKRDVVNECADRIRAANIRINGED